MKIVVSSTGDSIDSDVDIRFGRCSYFLLIEADKDIKLLKAEKNLGASGHGAGLAAAEQVANLKAEKVITGNLGPNAFRVLDRFKIECYSGSGKVRDAVKGLLQGKLEKIGSPRPGHFGFMHGRK